MLTHRQLFQQHLAQTSPAPLALEIVKAEGSFLFDADGKKYTDLISGIAVSNVGHRHPLVLAAIHKQLDQYMHLMVYGEYVQAPQVKLAHKLAQLLPAHLDSTYFTNSGAEAIEGAMKLAKRYTGRPEIVSFKKAYHGSTQGALSLMGDEFFKDAFRPLLPGIRQLTFNDTAELAQISENTAAVFIEPIQGEAGAIAADPVFMQTLRKRCDETGTLLVFDEIQTGFGRTGKLFALEHYAIIPDIVVLAKGMGGGMPLGAFVAPKKIMQALTENPVLGHITTFGGHPVCCAAALATIETVIDEKLVDGVEEREQTIRSILKHEAITEIRGKGLMLAVLLPDNNFVLNVIQRCVSRGVITDWFLFCDRALRIAPPLNITLEDLHEACTIIVESVEEVYKEGVLGN